MPLAIAGRRVAAPFAAKYSWLAMVGFCSQVDPLTPLADRANASVPLATLSRQGRG